MAYPSLLIIVPTLDSYLLLSRLVESLQSQSWCHWRLLFVDGPSGPLHRQYLDYICKIEPRCRWVIQNTSDSGIFGAMNQGFSNALPDDWLLFWGSDDWASGPNVFAESIAKIGTLALQPDLLICKGRYVDSNSGLLSRSSAFHAAGFFYSSEFQRSLFFGCTPPHQATFIGPGARRFLDRYSPGFRLSADLDYFLNLSRNPDVCVQCLDLDLVHMADGGVSGQQTQRRLQEVCSAYRRAFGWGWFFPFFVRYLRRLLSLLECPR